MMIWAMQPHDGLRGRAHDAGQSGAAHHHVGRSVPAQQLEDGVGDPARVSQLDGDLHPLRQAAEEVVKTVVVAFLVGRQLYQQHAATVRQLVPTVHQPWRPRLGPIQASTVAEAAGRAFTLIRNPGRSRRRQPRNVCSRGHR